MNQMPRRDRFEDEKAGISEIVAQHALPDFITGLDVDLGELDGIPISFIVYHLNEDWPNDPIKGKMRVNELISLHRAVRQDILDREETRYLFMRTRVVMEQSRMGR